MKQEDVMLRKKYHVRSPFCSYDSWREAFSKEQSRQEIERYKKPLVGTSWHGSDE